MTDGSQDELDASPSGVEDQSQLAEALRQKYAFEGLTKAPGWLILTAWMREQVAQLTDQVMLEPCTGLKSQLEQERKKGLCEAYRLLMQVHEVGLETAKAVAERLEEDARSDSPDDPDSAE